MFTKLCLLWKREGWYFIYSSVIYPVFILIVSLWNSFFSRVFQGIYRCSASGEWVNEEIGTKLPKCVPGTTKNCMCMQHMKNTASFVSVFFLFLSSSS